MASRTHGLMQITEGNGHCRCSSQYYYGYFYDDCDDYRPEVHPDATESCFTAFDDNCDGAIDEDGAVDALEWYEDSDGDGFGGETSNAQTAALQ